MNWYSVKKTSVLFLALFFLHFGLYSQVPLITGVSPVSGPVGTTVTISGSNFSTDPVQNIVRFGTVRAIVLSATAGTLTVIVPKAASYTPLSVTTGALTGYASRSFLVSFAGGYSFYDNSFPQAAEPLVTGKVVNALVATDLDDDGRTDLVVPGGNAVGALNLSIFRNTGSNRITAFEKKEISLSGVAGIAKEVAAGDFDGDGKQDLAIIVANTAKLVLLRNSSTYNDISFDPPVEIPITSAVSWIAIGDFNKDGKPDIALADHLSSVFIYSNTTANSVLSFFKGPELTTGTIPVGIHVADLDQDGLQDIITGSAAARAVYIHRNNTSAGIISFEERNGQTLGEIPFAIAIGDFETDGKPDIAVSLPGTNNVVAFKNASTPGVIQFYGGVTYPSAEKPKGIAIADMNGDGQADIITGNGGSLNISVIRNNTRSAGYFAFDMHMDYRVNGNNPAALVIADYNGDGQPDIAAGHTGLLQVSVLRNATTEPTVKSFTPQVASNEETVTITGTNFFDITGVSFGGVAAASYTVESATTIKAVLAAGATGHVQVQNAQASSTLAGFIFGGIPAITSFTPAASGTDRPVTITGKNFTGITAVKFGDKDARSYIVSSPTSIIARPAEGSSGAITVVNNYGSVTKEGFSYLTKPNITDWGPYLAKAGTTITLRGTEFADRITDNIVQFGTIKGVVTAATTTALSVTVPNGAPNGQVTVTSKQHTVYSKPSFVPVFPDGDVPFEDNFFMPAQELLSIPGPWDATSADIDGDGKLDLLVAGTNLNAIYLNKGTGGAIVFEKVWEMAINMNELGRNAIAAGDLNADGKPDLVINAPTLKVLINTSTGNAVSFAEPVNLLNYASIQTAVTDLDGDGRPEVIAGTGSRSPGIVIFRNTGNPSSIQFEMANTQLSFAGRFLLTDLDLDGKADFAVPNSGSQDISIIRNNCIPGDIIFETPRILLTPGYPLFIAAEDVNADGRKDLAIAIWNSTSWCLIENQSGTGALVFKAPVSYQTEKSLSSIQLSDLNGDGKADVILSYLEGSNISIVKNTTPSTTGNILSPTFGEKADYLGGKNPGEVLVSDWNGDNTFDLTVLSKEDKIILFRNNLFRPVITSFSPTQVMPGTKVAIKGYNFKEVSAVRFGNKQAASFRVISSTDIEAEVGEGNEGTLTVTNPWLTNGKDTITFMKPSITAFTPVAGSPGTIITITGTNFSTRPASNVVYFGAVKGEVISASATDLQVRVPVSASYQLLSVTTFGVTGWSAKPFNVTFPGIGSNFTESTFGDRSNHLVNPVSNVKGVASGDLNNDGLPDLAVADLQSKSLSILINTSTAGLVSFATPMVFGNINDPNRVVMGDFNGDGHFDIAVVSVSTGRLSILKNTGTGSTISFSMLPELSLCGDVNNITAGDLDGDGKTDLVMSNGSYSKACILRNTSKGDDISFLLTGVDNYMQYVLDAQITDIDGDNKPELLITREAARNITVFRNLSQPGNIVFAYPDFIELHNHGYNLVAGDFDGDNKPDLAVLQGGDIFSPGISLFRNTSTRGNIRFEARGNLPVEYGIPWSLQVSDLDGDGKPDIIAAKGGVSTTRVVAFKNISSGTDISFNAGIQYRPNFDCTDLTINDIDGDGRQDIITAYPGGSSEPGGVTILRNKIGEPAITPNGANPVTGNVVTRTTVDPTVQSLNDQPYVQRHSDLNPVHNSQTATATIILFFTQQEFDNFNATANHGPDLPRNANDAMGKSNLRVFQYHGTSYSGLPGTYTGTGKVIDPADADIVWNAIQKYWEVKFAITGFSGFFVSSIGFQFNQTPAPVITADYASFCQGGKVLLKSSSENNNQWYRDGSLIPGAIGNTYQASIAGNYNVTATNNSIVSPLSKMFIVIAGAAPTKPDITRTHLTLSSSSPSGNQWYRNGVAMPGVTSREIIPVNGSHYAVQVSLNGCVSAMSDDYYFLTTGVIDIDDQQYIRLTPNPVRTEARLDFRLNNISMLNISVTDLNGRTVLRIYRQTTGNRINLTHLPKGLYAVRFTSNNGKAAYIIKVLKH